MRLWGPGAAAREPPGPPDPQSPGGPMDSVRIYLRAPLFTARSAPHLPAKAVILEGTVDDRSNGGVLVTVTAWADFEGKALEGEGRRLFVPLAKIDHIELLGAPA